MIWLLLWFGCGAFTMVLAFIYDKSSLQPKMLETCAVIIGGPLSLGVCLLAIAEDFWPRKH